MAQTADSFAEGDAATPVAERQPLPIGIAGAIIGALIILECAAAHIYFAGGYFLGQAVARKAVAADEPVRLHEVDLGKFSLTASDPKSSGSLLIEFHLVGSVVAGNSGAEDKGGAEWDGLSGNADPSTDVTENDNAAFEKRFRKESSRFRDQVIAIIGDAQISALSDPGLGAIKGQILAKTNSLLGKPLLKEIRFSDFAVVQQ